MTAKSEGAELSSDSTLRIERDDRYHRQRLISWWDQQRIRDAHVLVIGAGALGNEILKTLALLGIGRILLYDMDVIEASNLSRGVLFRSPDEGQMKAEVAARRLCELNPDVKALGRAENIIEHAGLGIFHWADIVIGGLDNRIARIFVNRAAAWTGRAWVDGAIEGLDGIVRVFDPLHTACYECTMNDIDRRLVNERMSCAMLARDIGARGYVPNTAVMASVIGALEVQEAIKVLHHQPALYGEGLHVNGLSGDVSRVRYPRREDCMGHQHAGPLIPLGVGTADLTLDQLLTRAEHELGSGAVLDLSRDVITWLECLRCNTKTKCGRVLGSLREAEARCPTCGEHRAVIFTSSISRSDDLEFSWTLAQIGIPPFDSVVVRRGLDARQAWLFDADAPAVLGSLTS